MTEDDYEESLDDEPYEEDTPEVDEDDEEIYSVEEGAFMRGYQAEEKKKSKEEFEEDEDY